MHRADLARRRTLRERGQDRVHVPAALRALAVRDGKVGVRDGGGVDVERGGARGERAGGVRTELARLGQVDEGAHARVQQRVELGRGGARAPGVLAREQGRCGPVGIGDGARVPRGEWAAGRGGGDDGGAGAGGVAGGVSLDGGEGGGGGELVGVDRGGHGG